MRDTGSIWALPRGNSGVGTNQELKKFVAARTAILHNNQLEKARMAVAQAIDNVSHFERQLCVDLGQQGLRVRRQQRDTKAQQENSQAKHNEKRQLTGPSGTASGEPNIWARESGAMLRATQR